MEQPNVYLYRGEQYDPDLGLYYLRARYMNPSSGKFISRDPVDGSLTNPSTLHKYLYANGDPINGSDPSGLATNVAYVEVNQKISIAPVVIRGLQATTAAIVCADLWIGSKTYAETVAGPFGSVTQVAPCIWIGKKSDETPIAPPLAVPISVPNAQNPPNNRCAPYEAAIQTAMEKVKKRYNDMLVDKNKLYPCRPGHNPEKPWSGTWPGHQHWFVEKAQVELEEAIEAAEAQGCPVPPDAPYWAKIPPPACPAP